jgi:hypothetical protein
MVVNCFSFFFFLSDLFFFPFDCAEYFEDGVTGMHGDGGFSFNPQYEKDTIYAWTPIKRKPGTELSPTEKMFNYSVCVVYLFFFF